MAEQINANLQATIEIKTDFSDAIEEINNLVKYVEEKSKEMVEALSKPFSIKPSDVIKENLPEIRETRIEEKIQQATGRPRFSREELEIIAERINQQRRELGLPEVQVPQRTGRIFDPEKRGFLSTQEVIEKYTEAIKETKKETPRPPEPIKEERIAPVTTTRAREQLDVNINVNVKGGTQQGTVENLVEQIFKDPSFERNIETKIREIYNKIRFGE